MRFKLPDISDIRVVYLIYLLFYINLFPTINVVLSYFDYRYALILNYNIQNLLLVWAYTIIFVIFSFFIFPLLLSPFKRLNKSRHPSLIYRLHEKRKTIRVICISCFMVANTIMLLYFAYVGSIPFLHPNASVFRSTAKAGVGEYILISNAAAICFSIHSGFLHVTSRFKLNKFLIALSIVLTSIINMGAGFRGGALYIILAYVFTIIVVDPQYKVKRELPPKLIIFTILLIFSASLLGMLRHGEVKLNNLLPVILWIGSVNFYNFVYIEAYFSDPQNWMLGQSFVTDLMTAIPGVDSQFLGVKLKQILGLEFKGQGMTVTAPGEGYVNFGFTGLIGHAIFLSLMFYILHSKLHQLECITRTYLLIFFCLYLPKFSTSGIMPTLIFSITPQILFYMFVLFSVGRSFKRYSKK